jgi:hypothetical protein
VVDRALRRAMFIVRGFAAILSASSGGALDPPKRGIAHLLRIRQSDGAVAHGNAAVHYPCKSANL